MTRQRRAGRDDGSTTLEVAILTPALILLLGAMIVVGRIQLTAGAVEHAAAAAAREASLARTAGVAITAARSAAERALATTDCATSDVQVDTTGLSAPLGQPATVRVTVSCVIDLSDLAIPGLPGTRTQTASALSPIDAWRQR
ncbi:MAG: pilus assembly protein [Actinomycetales bacterium]|nr:pilus assembly protein [Actinomycetales bacterium]